MNQENKKSEILKIAAMCGFIDVGTKLVFSKTAFVCPTVSNPCKEFKCTIEQLQAFVSAIKDRLDKHEFVNQIKDDKSWRNFDKTLIPFQNNK
jgi:hypothetical protein